MRPHALRVGEPGIRAEVAVVERLGNEQVVHLLTPGGAKVVAVVPPDFRVRPEEQVEVGFPPEEVHLFRGHNGRRISLPGAD